MALQCPSARCLVQVLHRKRSVNAPSQKIIRYSKYNRNNNHKRLFETADNGPHTNHKVDLSSGR